MDKEIQIFKSEEFGQVRTLTIEGYPFLVGKDIAEILQYNEPSKAVTRHVDEDDRIKHPITDNLGRIQESWIINESGLYSLILSSKLPGAKKFKRWVTSEVLPSIRKSGGYIATTDNMTDEEIMAKALLVAQNTIKKKNTKINELEEKIEINKHKVSFAEAVENSDDVILVKEMATIISQNGFEIGQNQLFEFLRMYGYLCSKKGGMYNLPTKKHEDLFKVTKRTVQHSKGIEVKNTPKLTGKGQLYFIKKFAEYKLQGLTIKELLNKKKEAI